MNEIDEILSNLQSHAWTQGHGTYDMSDDTTLSEAKSALIQYFKDLLPERMYTPLDIGNFPAPKRAKILTAIENWNACLDAIEQSLKENTNGK